ncbi:hypothetical protein Tsubulata_016967 [Turnera subulata]|uniref:CSN8/PSMD8/EIF3K domain-containing protein n=1 Tax=Turnera subulata TaxID=218843 RepID=A0A9Q0J097_9ROSI|nr:hypothetical protein Tsubulata_016967 [Turnera subulata]
MAGCRRRGFFPGRVALSHSPSGPYLRQRHRAVSLDSIPSSVKENRPELAAMWKIGQKVWTRDYAGVHEAIRGFDWSQDILAFVDGFAGK